jgi:hypothetical protein
LDIDDLVQVFSDRQTVMSGVVNDLSGRPIADQTVVVLPTDRSMWTAGVTMLTSTSQRGTFEVSVWPGGGEYFVAGLPEALRARHQEPAVLEALSPLATKVRIEEGQSARVTVTVPDRVAP